MYKDALTAVEQSMGNDGKVTYCEATDDNLANLRTWVEHSRRTSLLRRYGETATAEGREFLGWDWDHEGRERDWCVVILDEDEE